MLQILRFIIILYILITSRIFSFSLENFAIEPKLGAKIFFQVDSSKIELKNARFYYLEAYYTGKKDIDIGLGAGYEVVEGDFIISTLENSRESIKNIPIYLSVKYYLGRNNDVNLYTKGTLGYSIMNSSKIINIGDSRFYSIGFGLDMDNFIAELNLDVSRQIKKNELLIGSISYDFTLGYRF